MDTHETLLVELGLAPKEARVYLALVKQGPSSVRQLAAATTINRGTVYDVLKELQAMGLARFYNEETRQYFVAAPPSRLHELAREKAATLQSAETRLQDAVPVLESLYDSGERHPVARIYEGAKGIKVMLEDVLETMQEATEKEYYVYSSSAVRDAGLYAAIPDYTTQRLTLGISVKNISLGAGGGTSGLDERKWIPAIEGAPTYILMYGGKVANIFLDRRGELVGLIVENRGIYETQRLLFLELWNRLL